MLRARRTAAVLTVIAVSTLAYPSMTASASTSRAGMATTAQARSQGSGQAEEQAFVAKINALRTSKGLAPLQVDPELLTQGRIWADTMRKRGDIFHSQTLAQGISANWQKLGENVGVGPTVDQLFDAFVASPKHYENLVDPKYRFIGVGVVWDGDTMYTAHRFMALFPAGQTAATSPPAKSPAPAPTTSAAPAPTTVPEELAAAEPTTTTSAPPAPEPPPAPAPTIPSAYPERVGLVLRALSLSVT